MSLHERLTPQKAANPNDVGLPIRPFLYTLDQIGALIAASPASVRRWCHFDGRSIGARPIDKMLARNIANEGDKPEWRVAEREVIRWLKRKGFKVYERGWVSK